MLVLGLDEIGRLFGGKSRFTIARWIKKHGLIARRLPSGVWFTSLSYIEQWILDGYKADPLISHDTDKPFRPRQPQKPRRSRAGAHAGEVRAHGGAGRSVGMARRAGDDLGGDGRKSDALGAAPGKGQAAAHPTKMGEGTTAGTQRRAQGFFT